MGTEYRESSVHNHSTLCDGKNSLQEMALAAWKNGIKTLGFSGHSHTPCDLEYCMSPGRTSQYKAEINRLKAQYAGKMDILCGIEWDQFSDDDPHAYEYWIGSVHYICGPRTGNYYEIDWRKSDLRRCIDEEFDGDGLAMAEHYFHQVAQVAAMKPTILAHLDLVKKLNGDGEFFDEESPRYKAAALGALEAAAKAGCLLEVNSGGIYRGYRKDRYPSDELLKEWNRLGGKIILTTDSHDTGSIVWGLDESAEAARQAGFTQVAVLTAKGVEMCDL